MFKQLTLGREQVNLMQRLLKWMLWLVGSFLLLIFTIGVVLLLWFDQPFPTGKPGAEADALAQRMLTAINHDAWLQTGAVAWDFDGRQQHLWDRERHLARVRWGKFEVLMDLSNKQGMVREQGQVVSGPKKQELLNKAWAHWANDSFWLNPVSKVFDEGTRRELVLREDGRQALLVTFSAGGVTPGDSYLWILGEDGKPEAWRMWVKILPLGGLRATWQGWHQTEAGVWVASRHKIFFLSLELNNIRCVSNIRTLFPEKDPFAELFR